MVKLHTVAWSPHITPISHLKSGNFPGIAHRGSIGKATYSISLNRCLYTMKWQIEEGANRECEHRSNFSTRFRDQIYFYPIFTTYLVEERKKFYSGPTLAYLKCELMDVLYKEQCNWVLLLLSDRLESCETMLGSHSSLYQ